jgi:2-polyprenyl-3-methyl-5-hydroxy-6-metoxy-1,4-benzoquinol methylase
MKSDNAPKLTYTRFEDNRSLEDAKEIYLQRIEDARYIFKKHKDSFNHRNCPYCGADDYSHIEDFDNSYKVAACNVCSGHYVNPCPDVNALSDYYNNGRCNILLEEIVKKRQNRKSVSFIFDNRLAEVCDIILNRLNKKEIKILEIGCSSGIFLDKLQKYLSEKLPNYQFSLFGVDIDSNAICNSANDSLNLICQSIESYLENANQTFDIILHFELIEHLFDPYNFILNVKKLLSDDGYMLFTTPNYNGLEMIASSYNDFRLLAHGIFPPMHLNAFSTINISHFIIRAGLRLVNVSTPGNFDVDMVRIAQNKPERSIWSYFNTLDENTLGFIQEMVKSLKCSSHMMVCARK